MDGEAVSRGVAAGGVRAEPHGFIPFPDAISSLRFRRKLEMADDSAGTARRWPSFFSTHQFILVGNQVVIAGKSIVRIRKAANKTMKGEAPLMTSDM